LVAVATLLSGAATSSDPYAFKCNNAIEGGFTCENKGLGESLRFLKTDLESISKIAKPFDL